jgi:hypothetical protein
LQPQNGKEKRQKKLRSILGYEETEDRRVFRDRHEVLWRNRKVSRSRIELKAGQVKLFTMESLILAQDER